MLTYVCTNAHTEFSYGSSSKIDAVIMFPGYEGNLPGGVSFDQTREELLAQLGEPHVQSGTFCIWQGDGMDMWVHFDPASPGAVHHIVLQLPSAL